MTAWVRCLHDQEQPGRAYVCWTSPGHEEELVVHSGRRGDAFREAVKRWGSFVCLDWDIAYNSCDMHVVEEAIAERPDMVAMGPYLMFPSSTWKHNFGWQDTGDRPEPVWSGMVWTGNDWRRITRDDQTCQAFGFGLVYLPEHVVKLADQLGVLDQCVYPYDDAVFSDFFWRQGGQARVLWECVPKHLHFDLPDEAA